MAFFDEIGKKLLDASQSVAQKGKEMGDSFRINSLISEEEKRLTAIYLEIGKKYVSLYEGQYAEEFNAQVEEVKRSVQKIEELNKQLLEVKSTVKCNSCGAENSKVAQFCSTCGDIIKEESNSNEKKCINCGVQISEGVRFCTSCGHPVEESKGE